NRRPRGRIGSRECKSAQSGKPDGRQASPLEPRVQGRSARIATAETSFRATRPSRSPVRPRVSPPSDRAALRKTLRERRRSLLPQHRIAAAEALANRLLALPFFSQDGQPASGYVAGYWAMDGEIGL